jgi:hypothetical protein
MGNGIHKAVSDHAADRQRHRFGIGSGKCEADILESQFRLEARRLVTPLRNQRAVALVDRT